MLFCFLLFSSKAKNGNDSGSILNIQWNKGMIDQINTNWNNQIRSHCFIAWSSFKMPRVCLFKFWINSSILDPVGFELKIVECISIHCISTTLFINRIKCRWLIKYHSSTQQALYRITVQRWIFELRRREFQLGIKYKAGVLSRTKKKW